MATDARFAVSDPAGTPRIVALTQQSQMYRAYGSPRALPAMRRAANASVVALVPATLISSHQAIAPELWREQSA